MLVNQIAVFLENKQGRLNSLIKSVAAADINIESLNIADTDDFGIVRMVTSDNARALNVIKSAGFTASTVDLVGVEVKDKPGSFAGILEALSANGISIEYVYSFTCREGITLILFKTAQRELAEKVLEDHLKG
jgi:hypothetical protein